MKGAEFTGFDAAEFEPVEARIEELEAGEGLLPVVRGIVTD